MHLSDIATPALILDRRRLMANVTRLSQRAKHLGVALRPHVKTAKCAQIAALAVKDQAGGITVSTLKEAAYFFDHGFKDIIYGVGIVPHKLAELDALQVKGARIRVILDSPEMARAVGEAVCALSSNFDVLIEIDSGGRRGGVVPDDPALVDIGRIIHASPKIHLVGVLSHAGHSYHCRSQEAIEEVAEQERCAVVQAATRLTQAGLPCPIVSVGSTPTALFARDLTDVTEMRPGVYTLFDMTQVELGCCTVGDIAVSVLTSVIGHGRAPDYALIDAGGLALSKDLSASEFDADSGYGPVFDERAERRFKDMRVSDVQQEHGFITVPSGALPLEDLAIGSRVRILPIHACMTAAPYDKYYVVEGDEEIKETWDKITGW